MRNNTGPHSEDKIALRAFKSTSIDQVMNDLKEYMLKHRNENSKIEIYTYNHGEHENEEIFSAFAMTQAQWEQIEKENLAEEVNHGKAEG